LQNFIDTKEAGVGKAFVFLTVVLCLVVVILGLKLTNRAAPAIAMQRDIRGIGVSTPVEFRVHDSSYRIKSVAVYVRQGDRTFQIPVETTAESIHLPQWWKLWSRRVESSATYRASVGRKAIPDLKEGSARLIVTATNNSWGRFFRGGQSNSSRIFRYAFSRPAPRF